MNQINLKKKVSMVIMVFVVAMVSAVIGVFLFSNAQADESNSMNQDAFITTDIGVMFHWEDLITHESGDATEIQFHCETAERISDSMLGTEGFRVYGVSNSEPVDHDIKITLIQPTDFKITNVNISLDLNIKRYYLKLGLPSRVTFNANGGAWEDGDTQKSLDLLSGKSYEIPKPNPVLDNHAFLGYFTEKEGGIRIIEDAKGDVSVVPEGNSTVWAHWKDITGETKINFTTDSDMEFYYFVYDKNKQTVLDSGQGNQFEYLPISPKEDDKLNLNINLSYSFFDIKYDDLFKSPLAFCAWINNDIEIFFYTKGSEGNYIESFEFLGNSYYVCDYTQSVLLAGQNDIKINIKSKQDFDFNIQSKNNVVYTLFNFADPSKSTFCRKTSFNCPKDTYIFYNLGFIGRISPESRIYDTTIEIGILAPNENGEYKAVDEGYVLTGASKQIDSGVVLKSKLIGYEYNGIEFNKPFINYFIANDESGTFYPIVEGDNEPVNSVFNANGGKFSDGSETLEIDQYIGEALVLPSNNPVLEDMEFQGWYTDPEGGDLIDASSFPFDPDDVDAKANEFYAHWDKPQPPTPGPEPVVDPTVVSGNTSLNTQTSDLNFYVLLVLAFSFACSSLILIRKKHK